MLAANTLANLVGVILNTTLVMVAEGPVPEEIWQNPIADVIDSAFTPAAFIFVTAMTLLYERPIRSFLNSKFKNQTVPEVLKQQARQRLLNEPFVLIALSFSMWLLSAIIYPTLFWIFDVGPYWIQRSFFMGLSTGLVTATVAFFCWNMSCRNDWHRIFSRTAAFIPFLKRCGSEYAPGSRPCCLPPI